MGEKLCMDIFKDILNIQLIEHCKNIAETLHTSIRMIMTKNLGTSEFKLISYILWSQIINGTVASNKTLDDWSLTFISYSKTMYQLLYIR